MQLFLLSPFAIYCVVFDLTKFKTLAFENENEYDFESINQSIDYINYWLKQISIHANKASVFLIGTHADLIVDENKLYSKINDFLKSKIEEGNFVKNEDLIFFPIDNEKRTKLCNEMGFEVVEADGLNIKNVKEKISQKVNQNYNKKSVPTFPISCIDFFENIVQQNIKYIDFKDKNKFENFKEECDEPLLVEKYLQNLVDIGFVFKIENFYVFDAMWLIKKISFLVRDFYLHPDFEVDVELMKNKNLSFEWRMLTQHGLLSDAILDVFWNKKIEYINNENEYEEDKNLLLKIMIDADVIVEIKNIENKKFYFLPFASIAATSLEKSFSNFNYSKTIDDYAKEENCFVLKCSTTFPADFFFRFIVAIQKKQQETINNSNGFFDFNISNSFLDFLPSNHCYFFPCINRSINGNIVAYLKINNCLFLIPLSKISNKIVLFHIENVFDEDSTFEIKILFENIFNCLIEKYYKKTFSIKIKYLKNKKNFDDANKKTFSNKIETYFNDNNSDFFHEVFLNFFLMWSSSKFFEHCNILDVFYEIIKKFLYDEVDLSLFGIINDDGNNFNQLEIIKKKFKYYLKHQPLILEYNLNYNFDEKKFEKKFGDEQEWRGKKINWKELKNNFDFFDDLLNKTFEKNVQIEVILKTNIFYLLNKSIYLGEKNNLSVIRN
jgi:hypothetical protein